MHYVGDLHQPLHAVARITEQDPTGDAGGNSFDLLGQGDVENLHSLWDSAIYFMPKNDKVVNISLINKILAL